MSAQAPGRPLRRSDLVVLSVGTFTLGVDGFVLSGLLPQVSASLRVPVATAGQLTTLFALVYALASPLIAALAGSWDRRRLLVAGMAVFVVGVGLQATAPTFAVLAAGRVVAAVGAAGYQATAYATAGLLTDDEHRPRALAVVAAGSSVASVAGLPFGVLVGQRFGWRAAIWVLVVLGVVSAVAVLRLPAAHAPAQGLRQRLGVLGDRRVLAVLAGTITVLTPGFVIIAYLPAILSGGGGWVVLAVLGYGAGQVTGTALVPRLVDRRGPRAALLTSACVITAASAALTATRTVDVAAVVTAAVLGVAVGLAVVPQQSRLFSLVPDLAPTAVGLNGSAIYVGTALGAGAGGLALDLAGASAPTLAAAAIGVVAILVAALLVPERRHLR